MSCGNDWMWSKYLILYSPKFHRMPFSERHASKIKSSLLLLCDCPTGSFTWLKMFEKYLKTTGTSLIFGSECEEVNEYGYLKSSGFYDLCCVTECCFWQWYQRTDRSKDRICVRHVGFHLISSERDWRIIPGLTWISCNYTSKIGCFWNWFNIASSCGILYKRFWTPGFCYHGLVTTHDEDFWVIHDRECKFSDRQSS